MLLSCQHGLWCVCVCLNETKKVREGRIKERGRWEESCAALLLLSLLQFHCVCPLCVVVMVVIGAAIKSVLRYLNRSRGECDCVAVCVCVCCIDGCVCWHFVCLWQLVLRGESITYARKEELNCSIKMS